MLPLCQHQACRVIFIQNVLERWAMQESICIASSLQHCQNLKAFRLKVRNKDGLEGLEPYSQATQHVLDSIVPTFRLMSRLHTLEITALGQNLRLTRWDFVGSSIISCNELLLLADRQYWWCVFWSISVSLVCICIHRIILWSLHVCESLLQWAMLQR